MLSVVCPVHNEAENIGALLVGLRTNVSIPLELLIVYDDEGDNTIPALGRIASSFSFEIRSIKNQFGSGPLGAIRTGFLESRKEAVLVLMADLSDDLSVVDDMYGLLVQGRFDIVCGSRYMPGGKHNGGPPIKRLLSRLAGISLHYVAGIPTRDVTNSFKMYRRDLLESIEIESDGGFEVGMEILVKSFAAGKRITELPSTWTDRVAGKSRFRLLRWIPKYLRWYVYAVKNSLVSRK